MSSNTEQRFKPYGALSSIGLIAILYLLPFIAGDLTLSSDTPPHTGRLIQLSLALILAILVIGDLFSERAAALKKNLACAGPAALVLLGANFFFSVDRDATWFRAATILALIAAWALASTSFSSPENRNRLLRHIIAASALHAVFALARFIGGIDGATHLAGNFFWPNPFASSLLIPLAASVGFAVEAFKSKDEIVQVKVLYALSALLFAVCLVLTKSVGAGMALIGGVIYLGLSHAGTLKKKLPAIAAGLVLVVLLALMLGGPGLLEGFREQAPHSLLGRVNFWQASLASFREHPLTGTGLDSFKVIYGTHQLDQRFVADTPHSLYIRGLQEGGVIGGLLAVWTLWAALTAFVRREGRLAVWAGAGIAALAAHLAVDFSWIYLAVMFPAALAWGAYRGSKDKSPEQADEPADEQVAEQAEDRTVRRPARSFGAWALALGLALSAGVLMFSEFNLLKSRQAMDGAARVEPSSAELGRLFEESRSRLETAYTLNPYNIKIQRDLLLMYSNMLMMGYGGENPYLLNKRILDLTRSSWIRNPRHFDTCFAYGSSLAQLGSEEEQQQAVELMVEAARFGGISRPRNYVMAANLLLREERPAEAAALLKGLIDEYERFDITQWGTIGEAGEFPHLTRWLADAHLKLAAARRLQGEFDAAFSEIERAREIIKAGRGSFKTEMEQIGWEPQFGMLNEEATRQEGLCLEALGRDAEAAALLNEVVENYPGDLEAKDALERIKQRTQPVEPEADLRAPAADESGPGEDDTP